MRSRFKLERRVRRWKRLEEWADRVFLMAFGAGAWTKEHGWLWVALALFVSQFVILKYSADAEEDLARFRLDE